jgi:hypothetical protein
MLLDQLHKGKGTLSYREAVGIGKTDSQCCQSD